MIIIEYQDGIAQCASTNNKASVDNNEAVYIITWGENKDDETKVCWLEMGKPSLDARRAVITYVLAHADADILEDVLKGIT